MPSVMSMRSRQPAGLAETGLVSKEKLGNGLAIARVRIPSPEFKPAETLKLAVHIRAFQKGVYDALAEGHPWRRLLAEVYGDEIPKTIKHCFDVDGPDSQEAENLLEMLIDEYRLYTWQEMFFYWIHVDPGFMDRAIDTFFFWPMHRRFLELVDRKDQRLLHCRCPDGVEEFQFLCESMGLIYCASQIEGRCDHKKAPLEKLSGKVAKQEKAVRDRIDVIQSENAEYDRLKVEWLKRREKGEDLPAYLVWAAEKMRERRGDHAEKEKAHDH